jgi:hypothetical protein
MSNFVTSWIRTNVPFIVSGLVTWLMTVGLQVPADVQASIVVVATWLLGSLYYALVRWAETKWPWIGNLLGVASQPKYK